MGRTCFSLSLLMLLACSHASSSSPPPSEVPLRATSGPASMPKPAAAPTDRDGDRVPDVADGCPTVPGSLRDGCPVVDGDGDGISDRFDKCPTIPEVRDGRADGDGCPLGVTGK